MATKPDKILIRQIQLRRDSPENWVLHDPVLAEGEMGVELDPNAPPSPSLFKIGDGIHKWTELPYGGLKGADGVVAISTKALNRLVFDTDNSLYVPELQIDLVDIYTKAKTGELVDLSTYAESEKVLGLFAQTLASDIADASTTSINAGEVLSALTAVYERNGVVKKLDYRDSDNINYLLGITTTAAPLGGKTRVQRTGVIEDNFWNFTPGRVYLGENGSLTQVVPSDGFDLFIGTAVSPHRLVLNIQDPIEILE
jgi:hypothetical protein